MKDDRLEKEFGEYFKGVNTPDNITGDAKRFVKPKQRFLPKFVKFASVAASFVLVFAVALTIILKTDFNKKPPAADGDGTPAYTLYTDAELTSEDINAYKISALDASLKFIENFALASNARVDLCQAKYKDGKLALARADVSILSGTVRDDTSIYVEFTDEKVIYGELKDYYDGQIMNYRGAQYYLTESIAENGEPRFRLHVNYGGVKYYFDVTSSDSEAYIKYLNLIVK